MVSPEEQRESERGPIRAVVRVAAPLPPEFAAFFKTADATISMNSFAALGALTWNGGRVYIGSRLTIYSVEDAWPTLHLPLLLFTTICGAEAILGGVRRSLSGEGDSGGASSWTASDLAQVRQYLSRVAVCTIGGQGLNNMEMAARDLPPHFGAWCTGKLGNNPAYLSFLPNALHSVSGIAANVAVWALGRAQMANAVLASLGVRV